MKMTCLMGVLVEGTEAELWITKDEARRSRNKARAKGFTR